MLILGKLFEGSAYQIQPFSDGFLGINRLGVGLATVVIFHKLLHGLSLAREGRESLLDVLLSNLVVHPPSGVRL